MNIADLIKESHATATSKGWWEPELKGYICEKCHDCFDADQTDGKLCPVCLGDSLIGFYGKRSFGDQIALMHSELSEALEEFRGGEDFKKIYFSYKDHQGCKHTFFEQTKEFQKPEGIAVELADVLIRIFDTCGKYNIPLEEALKLKLAYNKTRPHRHGGKAL